MSRLLYQAELHRRETCSAALAIGPVRSMLPCSCEWLSPFTESNRRPSPYHGDALPTELKGRCREPSETLPDASVTAVRGARTLQARTNSRRWVALGAA